MTNPQLESVSVWPSSKPAPMTGELEASEKRVKLLLVDDDDGFREAATMALSDLGFDVVPLADGGAMFDVLATGDSADVIILDWKLPTGCGLDLLPRLRRRGIQVPVVFLTGVPATTYENAALEGGALDFVDKTRGIDILAKRIRLIVDSGKRPSEMPAPDDVCCGPLTLKPAISRAYWNGTDVTLTVTEFNIVHLLVTRSGEYVTYRAIYDCVHHAGFIAGSGEDGFRTNVRSSMKRIRTKFRALDDGFCEIENFPAFGYRWRSAASVAA
jgi:two-component system, OmpR family, response regulator ChvI